jgi:hypothetical protein
MSRRLLTALLIVILVIATAAFWNARRGDGTTRPSARARSTPAEVLDTPPVQILVTKLQPTPGEFVYRYTVINGSAFPITDVEIGRDYYQGVIQLNFAPKGWDGSTVPASSYKSPPGWSFRNEAVEDDSVAFLHWSSDRPGEAIMGGASVGGFEVTVPTYDAPYEHGSWTVLLDSADEPTYTAVLQPTSVTGVPVSSMFAKSDLRISPNPSRGTIEVRFAVPGAGQASVDVFDALGRHVRRLMNSHAPEGGAVVTWDGKNTSGAESAAGVYFIRVKTQKTVRFGRLVLLKAGAR